MTEILIDLFTLAICCAYWKAAGRMERSKYETEKIEL